MPVRRRRAFFDALNVFFGGRLVIPAPASTRFRPGGALPGALAPAASADPWCDACLLSIALTLRRSGPRGEAILGPSAGSTRAAALERRPGASRAAPRISHQVRRGASLARSPQAVRYLLS